LIAEQSPAWLDPRAAAARVCVSEATILRAARSGRLQGFKVGLGRKLWRFKPADVDAWIESSSVPVPVQA
jgi:excisionase family DNA binding protein